MSKAEPPGISPWNGDCPSVAAGIYDVLNGHRLFVLYIAKRDVPTTPYHVTVQLSPESHKLYDGTGVVTKPELVNTAAASIAKPKWRDEVSQGIVERLSTFVSRQDLREMMGYDRQKVQTVREEIRRVQRE